MLRIGMIIVMLLAIADLAAAHNVTIFAWVEGDMVHTESKFARGRKAKNAPIEVYDSSGKKLLDGKTNENGEFSFKAPVKTNLTIVLLAGMGHQAKWTVPASEFDGVNDTPPNVTEAKSNTKPPEPDGVLEPVHPSQNMDAENIEAAVEKALDKKLPPLLDKKLQPVINILVDSQQKDPTIRDILGGLGYIFGLIGVAAYMNYRRKDGCN